MAVLVTGGAGYLGSHTCIELLSAGYEVIIADNLSNSKYESIKRIEELSQKTIQFYQVDIQDKSSLNYIFSENTIDSVIHFAGLKAVGESVQKPLEYYYNNLSSTLVLCEIMAKYNVKRLIFSSSATVYGIPASVPITEDFPRSATNPYGRSKLMIEEILEDLYQSDKDWSISLLRYFNPIGAHESGRIGEDPNGLPNNLMPYITQVAIGKLDHLNVFGNDYDTADGTGIRDFIHVTDLAKGHLKALEVTKTKTGIHAYNLGTGIGYSVFELIHSFEKVSGISIPYKVINRRAGDVGSSYSNPEKAFNVLNWKAEKTIEDMCIDAWRWQKNNPKGYSD